MTVSRWINFRMRNILDRFVEQIRPHILSFSNIFRKSCCLWDNVEKYGGARGSTNDVIVGRIWVACWISKATCTHEHIHAYAPVHTHACTRAHKYVIFIALPRQQWFANAPQYYVIRALLVLLRIYGYCSIYSPTVRIYKAFSIFTHMPYAHGLCQSLPCTSCHAPSSLGFDVTAVLSREKL